MAKLRYFAWAGLVRQVGQTELIVAADPQTLYEMQNGPAGLTLVEPKTVNTQLLLTEQTVPVAWGKETVISGSRVALPVAVSESLYSTAYCCNWMPELAGIKS